MSDTDLNPRTPGELATLAEQIGAEVRKAEEAWRDAVGHAIRAGELLVEAKRLVPHGGWGPWVEANFPGSVRTASMYMRLARNSERVADLPTIRDAVALLTTPKQVEPPADPVRAAAAKQDALIAEAEAIGEDGPEDHIAGAKAWLAVVEAGRELVRQVGRSWLTYSVEAVAEGEDAIATALARAGAAGLRFAARYEPWDDGHHDAKYEWDEARYELLALLPESETAGEVS